MPMFRVKFKDDYEKEVYTVYCKVENLDLRGHPYFVCLNGLIEPAHSPLIELNSKEKRRFRETKSLMIPIQNVVLIEQLDDEKSRIVEVPPLASFQKIFRNPSETPE